MKGLCKKWKLGSKHIRIAAQWRKWAGIKILPHPGIQVNTESRHWLIVLLSRHQSIYLVAFPGLLWIALWHPEESEPIIVVLFRLRGEKTKKHGHRIDMLCLNCFWNNRSRISNQVSTSQRLGERGHSLTYFTSAGGAAILERLTRSIPRPRTSFTEDFKNFTKSGFWFITWKWVDGMRRDIKS